MGEGEHTDGDHLAVMAGAGLMTHVAEIAPPVTAEAMARFRADAARQASNVMALASGRFALCLPPGRRELETRVAHKLLPIGAGGGGSTRNVAAEEGAGAPRRILPPSLRGRSAPPAAAAAGGAGSPADATRTRPGPAAPSHGSAAGLGGPLPGASPTGRVAPSGLGAPPPPEPAPNRAPGPAADPAADLAADLALGRPATAPAPAVAQNRDPTERKDARAEGGAMPHRAHDATGDRVETSHDLPHRADPETAFGSAMETALAAVEARLSETIAASLAATEARLLEGMEAAHGAQADALGDLRRAVDGVGHAQADDTARLGEAFATLRLGLRAVNDQLARLEAPPTAPAPARAAGLPRPAAEPAYAGPYTSATDHADGPVESGAERGELHGAVQALLGRLDWLEAGATAAAGRPAAPVWRRSPRALRDEAG